MRCVLGAVWLVAACDGGTVSWRVAFECDALEREADRVEIAVRRGSCDGAVIWSESLAAGTQPSTQPPSQSSGPLAFVATAFAASAAIASDCQLVESGTDANVVLTLRGSRCGDALDGSVDGATASCGDRFEGNHELALSEGISAGEREMDLRLCPGRDDWFRIDTARGHEIEASLEFADRPGYVELDLFDAGGGQIAIGRLGASGATASAFADATGPLYVRVSGAAPPSGIGYHLVASDRAGPFRYLAPEGDDLDDGSIDAPWRTFAHAIPMLVPGETLVLLDGTYRSDDHGALVASCTTTAMSGTETAPIRIVAHRERRAFLRSLIAGPMVNVSGCAHWTVEGLVVDGADRTGPEQPVVRVGSAPGDPDPIPSRDVVLRRLVVAHNNRASGGALLEIVGSEDVLLEEVEGYDFTASAILIYRARGVVVRRSVLHGRGRRTLVAGGALWPPKSGTASADAPAKDPHALHVLGASTRVSVENLIAERVFQIGLLYGTNDVFLGGTVILDSVWGVATGEGARDVHAENLAIVRSEQGTIFRNTAGLRFDRLSVIGGARLGLRADAVDATTLVGTLSCTDCLAVNNAGREIWIRDQMSLSLENTYVYDSTLPGEPDVDPPELAAMVTVQDPRLGDCLVYLPPDSPLRGAGSPDPLRPGRSRDIGASVLFRYEDRAETRVPLWDPRDGSFACGAVVENVNDAFETSCRETHRRLRVGEGSCPLPVFE